MIGADDITAAALAVATKVPRPKKSGVFPYPNWMQRRIKKRRAARKVAKASRKKNRKKS